jgi:hypothetical protein
MDKGYKRYEDTDRYKSVYDRADVAPPTIREQVKHTRALVASVLQSLCDDGTLHSFDHLCDVIQKLKGEQ